MKPNTSNTSKETKAELKQMSNQIKNLSDEKKKEYINTDEDTAYYIKAVSYTHLRAHETKAILVLRVML